MQTRLVRFLERSEASSEASQRPSKALPAFGWVNQGGEPADASMVNLAQDRGMGGVLGPCLHARA